MTDLEKIEQLQKKQVEDHREFQQMWAEETAKQEFSHAWRGSQVALAQTLAWRIYLRVKRGAK